MTIKIAHIADTHLGYRQYGLVEREKDFYDSFRIMIDDMLDKNVDCVLHSGDLFEQAKPPIEALLVAQECFEKLMENGIDVYVIAGNHDKIQKKGTVIPQRLYESEKFHILTLNNPIIEISSDIVLCGLPYFPKNLEDAVKDELYKIYEEVKNYPYKILMLHGSISKYFDMECEFELDAIPEGFDYYAMGHLHNRILNYDFKKGILSYPGSTEIKSKAEISDYNKNKKGYSLVSIDNSLTVEKIDFKLERKFISKTIKYYELDEKLNILEKKIKEEILTQTDKKPVLILTIEEGDFNRSDVSKRVYEQLGDITLNIRLTYKPTEEIMDGPIKKSIYSPEKVLEEVIDEEYEKDKKITRLGVDLYKELSIRNTEEAKRISDKFLEEYHSNKQE